MTKKQRETLEKTLDRCPFCGSKARFRWSNHWQPVLKYNAICEGCFSSSGWYGTFEEVIEAWNKRAN